MGDMDNNRRLKLIHGALRLTDKDVARATTLGGVEVSRHKAKSWLRLKSSSRLREGRNQRRYIDMTQEQFDAFLIGLKPMLDELEAAGEPQDDE